VARQPRLPVPLHVDPSPTGQGRRRPAGHHRPGRGARIACSTHPCGGTTRAAGAAMAVDMAECGKGMVVVTAVWNREQSGDSSCGLEPSRERRRSLWNPLQPILEAPSNEGFPPDFRSRLLPGLDSRALETGNRGRLTKNNIRPCLGVCVGVALIPQYMGINLARSTTCRLSYFFVY
jgi:hypothetical protein